MLARVESADLVKDFSSIILDIFNAVDMRLVWIYQMTNLAIVCVLHINFIIGKIYIGIMTTDFSPDYEVSITTQLKTKVLLFLSNYIDVLLPKISALNNTELLGEFF